MKDFTAGTMTEEFDKIGENAAVKFEKEEILNCFRCSQEIVHDSSNSKFEEAEYCNECSNCFCPNCWDFSIDLRDLENICPDCEKKNSEGIAISKITIDPHNCTKEEYRELIDYLKSKC